MCSPQFKVRANAGMTLLEVLAASTLLAILLSFSLQMFVTHNRITSLNRLEGIRGVERAFRESVREAVGVEDAVLSYQTSENQLVLRLPAVEGMERYCVWGALKQPDRLSVLHIAAAEMPIVERFETLPLPVEAIQFTGSGRTATLHFSLALERGERAPKRKMQYTATAACRAVAEDAS